MNYTDGQLICFECGRVIGLPNFQIIEEGDYTVTHRANWQDGEYQTQTIKLEAYQEWAKKNRVIL